MFLAEVLATLPYSVEEEPLQLIQIINRILSINASHYLSEFKNTLAGLHCCLAFMELNNAADPCDGTELDWICQQASIMMILLQLKHYLQRVCG